MRKSILILLALLLMTGLAASQQVRFSVGTNASLQSTATTAAGAVVVRQGYTTAGDVPPLTYSPSPLACSLNSGNGDNGSQVKSADNKCWLAVFPAGAYDARWWGVTYPFQMYAATGASDTNNYCFDAAHPCSLQHAADVAAQMDFSPARGLANPNQINIPGTYTGPGAIFSGAYYGTAGHGISGQYLYVVGNGSGNTHITNATGQAFSFDVSTGAGVVFQALNIQVGASQYGIFAQSPGSYAGVVNDVVVSSTAPGALAGLYAEGGALLERPANATITISGQFNCPIQANTGGYVEFDPGGSAVFSNGAGLTAVTAFICATAASKVQWYAASVTGAVTGDMLVVNGNSVVMQQAGTAQIPGNGFTRLEGPGSFITSAGVPVLTPTLGTCANGALAGTNNNYSMQISFTGANSTCAIVFGKLAGTTAGFAGFPRCFASLNTGGATNYLQPSTVSNTGITLLPNSALANGQAVYVTCVPQVGG